MLQVFCYSLFFVVAVVVAFENSNFRCNKKNRDLPENVKIQKKIFCDYDKTIRPVLEDEPLVISLQFLIYSFDLMERTNILLIKGWGVSKWRDEHIYWHPEDYNNLTTVFVPPKKVWTPDIVVFNAKNKYSSKLMRTTLCAMHYKKQVFCAFPLRMSGICKVDLTYWPFDTHNCTVHMESLHHPGDQIDFNVTESGAQHSGSQFKSPWLLLDQSVHRDPGKATCCPNITYPSLKFGFVIQRHAARNIVVILIPFIVLCSMTVLAVWLNGQSPVRIYLSAFSLTSHTYYLLNSTWELPAHADAVPKLILLLRNSQLLATLVLIETMVIRCVFSRNGDAPKIIVEFMSYFTKTTVGQIFLYPELYSNATAGVTSRRNPDDGENLVGDKSEINDWQLIGVFLDRLVFFSIIIVYAVMFVDCIPK